MRDNDQQLVIRAQQGDRKAFGKLVRRYQDKVLYLAYDIVGNYEDAQDVAQNAFLRAMNGLKKFKAQSTFSTWLYRIVVNMSIDHKRSIARRQHYSFDEPAITDSDHTFKDLLNEDKKLPDEIVELKDFGDRVRMIVQTFPTNQQVAFVLRYFHDMEMNEIANVLNCKAGTVRSHLFRALSKLRTVLKDYNEP